MKKFLLLPLLLAALAWSCQSGQTNSTKGEENLLDSLLAYNPSLQESGQIVLTYTKEKGSFAGKLMGFERAGEEWQLTYDTIGVTYGDQGFAPYGEKVEGDHRSPTGIFGLGPAFGYDKDIESRIEFIGLHDEHYWISESSSEKYNELVDYKPEEENVEKMLREDDFYEYGIVVRYNMEPAVPQKGSAIFLHIGPGLEDPTLGCIAMSREEIIRLIQWLDPAKKPVIVMGEYGELLGPKVYR